MSDTASRNASTRKPLDAVIIGAGPIGLAVGIALQKKGLRFVILEKGCIVNSIFHYPTNMTFFSTSERLEIGGVPFISHSTKPTRKEALEYYRRVVMAYQLPVHTYEAVQRIEKRSDIDARFEITTPKARYRTKNLILSTGFYDDANLLNVPGENLPKVRHYYNEPHPYALQKVAIIGGGNSAVDATLETYRCNAEVSLIVREKQLKEGVKYWVRPDIENRIREGAIKAYFEAQVLEITPKSLIIRDKEGKKMEFANDFVLAMTGYKPNYDILERLGVHLTEGALKVPEYDADTQQTNVAGLYLAGVICGGMQTNRWFIENTRDHGEKIAAHIQKAVN